MGRMKNKSQKSTQKVLRANIIACKIAPVADVVKKQMKAKGMTMFAVSKATGISHQTLGNFISRGRPMRTDKLALVLAALGLEIRPKE